MSYETITLDIENRVATLTLNRPQVMNAWNPQMAKEASDAIASLEGDELSLFLMLLDYHKLLEESSVQESQLLSLSLIFWMSKMY